MDHEAITPHELECMLLDERAKPKALSLALLMGITSGFSDDNKIGSGGFAVVYKGVLDNGTVAVKRLHETFGIDESKFSEEIHCLMKANHKNIVRFLGYCSLTKGELVPYKEKLVIADDRKRLLCFEYLHNGSLDKKITDASCGLEWRKRFQIINGICDGLDYLHQKCIVHLDLKPQNILLDDNMLPKITDFGLSRFLDKMQSKEIVSKVFGTVGYLAPEFLRSNQITLKSDIYSLGILISEIVTGEKCSPTIDIVLSNWKNRLEKSQAEAQLVEVHLEQVRVCTEIAIECTDFNSATRPDIKHIIYRLGAAKGADECATETGLAIGLKKSIEELYNMTSQNQHFSSMPEDRSNVQKDTDIRVTAPDMEETLIVGRDHDKHEILSILFESNTEDMAILPIYGIGGIGKTTLAQWVFRDTHFHDYSQVWVYVSHKFDLKRIGNSIISQLTNKISNIAEMQMLHNRLGELFDGNSIVIVLDDLWEEKQHELDKLKDMLRPGRGSNVVIVTTRDEAIARKISRTVMPYKLGSLTPDMCWSIIEKKSGLIYQPDKMQLQMIGREIALKSGGVALSAQSLGYILRDMTSDKWESVRDSYIWNLSTLEGSTSRNPEMLASLLLSYSHMPDWLKLCFSYCAVYPKGHNIVKYDLIHQWIALGFTNQSMELCEKYVTQLLEISFLQYSKTPSSDGRNVTLFTMHDLVYDLARVILADQLNDMGGAWGNRCRYALLKNCSNPLQLPMSYAENIKALHFLDCRNLVLGADAFSPAKFILVLDLSECFIQKLPDSIGQLKQLRYLNAPQVEDHMIPDCITELSQLTYLNLRGSRKISALPESIGDMKGLMHLDLSDCGQIRELPVSFAELKQLVHLDLSCCPVSISEAFGGFTKLEYLNLSVQFTIYKSRRGLQEVIGNLIKLRYLNLSGCMKVIASSKDQIDSLIGSISSLLNLEHLDLSQNTELFTIPESIANLKKLHTLDLSGCPIEYIPDSMSKMVSLKILNIDKSGFRESEISLSHFVVYASTIKRASNIIQLQSANPDCLMIDKLENVMSVEEAHDIKLIEKEKIKVLVFKWTVAASRYVNDKEVLEKLVPPSCVQRLSISGYMNVSIPDWQMGIWKYLPNLLEIYLWDFPECKNLPPLSQLPNLARLTLCRMRSLKEWSTAHSSVVERANKLMYPKLETLRIEQCARLRIKPCLPPRVRFLDIVDCDIALSWEESSSQRSASSASPVTMNVENSKLPLHAWRLLHQLHALHSLTITNCSDLTTSPEIFQKLSSLESLSLRLGPNDHQELPIWLVELTSFQQLKISHSKLEMLNENIRKLTQLQTLSLSQCRSMTSLPNWLGELTSLKKFEIEDCEGIVSFPDSIQLTNLEYLYIRGCPTLREWCESEENKMKLVHIKEKNIW